MEETYKFEIETRDGEKQEIEILRLTVRHGLRLQGKSEDEILEVLLDMVAPGVLDIISIKSMVALSEIIMEEEKDFFDQMATLLMKKTFPDSEQIPAVPKK